MKTIDLTRWLLGLWGTGLGFRITLELLVSDTGIFMPRNLENICFDFGTLAVLGVIVAVYETKQIIKRRWIK